MNPTEKEIQNFTLSLFNFNGYYLWRNNSFATSVESSSGRKHFIRAGKKGSADLIGVTPKGMFIALEIKRKGGKQSEWQKLFQSEVEQRGGIYVLISSIEQAEREVIKYA